MRIALSAMVLLSIALGGCDSAGKGGTPPRMLAASKDAGAPNSGGSGTVMPASDVGSPAAENPCNRDDDCDDGRVCERVTVRSSWEYLCVSSCESDSDCSDDRVCVRRATEGSACVPRCELDAEPGYSCVEGRPLLCEDVSAEEFNCVDCRHICQDARCVSGLGCVERRAVGEACDEDDECESRNCSRFGGVCRVALGDFCDESNCDLCLGLDDWTSCSRYCDGQRDGGCEHCLGSYETGVFYCHEECSDRGCPTSCEYYDGRDQFSGERVEKAYCRCDFCSRAEPTRLDGQPCFRPRHCESGACFGASDICEPFDIACSQTIRGVCTSECQTSADCSDGRACLANHCAFPCDNGECELGRCVEFEGGNSTLAVCDPRGMPGQPCRPDAMFSGAGCLSESCTGGKCAGTVPSGGACEADVDCAQGLCCAGVCRSAC